MTYQAIIGHAVPQIVRGSGGSAVAFGGSDIVDADGEASGGVFQSPVTDTITKIGFMTAAVTATGDVNIQIETVGADGLPTGTIWATGTSVTKNILLTDDNMWFEVTLDTPASVSRGDIFAVTITRPTSGTFNGRINKGGMGGGGYYCGFPYAVAKTTAWSGSGMSVNMSVCFATAGYAPLEGLYGISSNTFTVTFNNTSTPDVVGNIINVPWDIKVNGFWIFADLDADCVVKLYDSDGVTVLASTTILSTYPPLSTPYVNFMYFTSDVTLTASTNYYIAVEPSSTSNMTIYYLEFSTEAIKKQCGIFQHASYVSSKDPTGTGSWTTTTNKGALIGVLLSEIDIPTGGGGGLLTHPSMTGGIRG